MRFLLAGAFQPVDSHFVFLNRAVEGREVIAMIRMNASANVSLAVAKVSAGLRGVLAAVRDLHRHLLGMLFGTCQVISHWFRRSGERPKLWTDVQQLAWRRLAVVPMVADASRSRTWRRSV